MSIYDILKDSNNRELKVGQSVKFWFGRRKVTGKIVDIRIIGKNWKRARGTVFLDEPYPERIGWTYNAAGSLIGKFMAVREVRIDAWTHPEVIDEDLTTSENTVSL